MRIEFKKSFPFKGWTITDDKLLYKNNKKEYPLLSIKKVKFVNYSENMKIFRFFDNYEKNEIRDAVISCDYLVNKENIENEKKAIEFFKDLVGEENFIVADLVAQKQSEEKQKVDGYKKICNTCGNVFCYTYEDLKKNDELSKKALLAGLTQIGGALSGHYATGATAGQSADDNLARIVDYNKCPHCGSTDLRDATEEELQQFKNKNLGTPAVSAADELKKFKDLLDSGVITQEEFDQKKKQLLGL